MTARMTGDGFVLEQSPAAGNRADPRRRLHVDARPPRARRRRRTAVTLRELLEGTSLRGKAAGAGTESEVTAIAYDSRQVKPGAVFVAPARRQRRRRAVRAAGDRQRRDRRRRGDGRPGRRRRALDPGAAARARRSPRSPPRSTATRARSWRSSASPARTARRPRPTCWRRSSRRPASSAAASGRSATASAGASSTRARTTPEAPELQQMLRDMLKEGCGACVMEVSSHALALRRADSLRFAAGIFTNLTRDHLDFHGDMESYFAAKRRLFEILPDGAVGVDQRRRSARCRSGRRGAASGHLRDRRRRRRPARAAHLLARRSVVRGAHAARHVPRALAAGRPSERVQHPRRGGHRDGARRAVLGDRSRASATWRTCRAASRSCPRPPTTSASSSTTRTPTTR